MKKIQQKPIPVITVDGPSGSGKGTISQCLAKQLAWHFLDSGSLYRILAYVAKQRGIAFDDETALATAAASLDVQFVTRDRGEFAQIVWEGVDITDVIRTEACGNAASQVAAFPAVRTALLEKQHSCRLPPGLVADGRDMGTVIFPDAPLKVFLSASLEERARRRYLQLQEKGATVNFDAVLAEIKERDARDISRRVAPLKPAPDAFVIDTTHLSIEAVLAHVLARVKQLGFI